MKRNEVLFAVGSVVFFGLLVAMMLISSSVVPVQAEPLAAPTPVISGWDSQTPRYPLKFWDSKVITTDQGSAVMVLPQFEAIDIQYAIDQGVTPNTTTLTLQYSNDGVNWENGAAIVSNNTTDAAALNQFANFGIYTRVYADVANTEQVKVSVIGVAK